MKKAMKKFLSIFLSVLMLATSVPAELFAQKVGDGDAINMADFERRVQQLQAMLNKSEQGAMATTKLEKIKMISEEYAKLFEDFSKVKFESGLPEVDELTARIVGSDLREINEFVTNFMVEEHKKTLNDIILSAESLKGSASESATNKFISQNENFLKEEVNRLKKEIERALKGQPSNRLYITFPNKEQKVAFFDRVMKNVMKVTNEENQALGIHMYMSVNSHISDDALIRAIEEIRSQLLLMDTKAAAELEKAVSEKLGFKSIIEFIGKLNELTINSGSKMQNGELTKEQKAAKLAREKYIADLEKEELSNTQKAFIREFTKDPEAAKGVFEEISKTGMRSTFRGVAPAILSVGFVVIAAITMLSIRETKTVSNRSQTYDKTMTDIRGRISNDTATLDDLRTYIYSDTSEAKNLISEYPAIFGAYALIMSKILEKPEIMRKIIQDPVLWYKDNSIGDNLLNIDIDEMTKYLQEKYPTT